MSQTRPTRDGGYRLDDEDSVTVAQRVDKLMEAVKPRPLKKADLARHLHMHASHVGNLFSTTPGVARRWQRWHVVGTAELLEVTEAELLKGTKLEGEDLGPFEPRAQAGDAERNVRVPIKSAPTPIPASLRSFFDAHPDLRPAVRWELEQNHDYRTPEFITKDELFWEEHAAFAARILGFADGPYEKRGTNRGEAARPRKG